ncbi:RELT-like protein 2 isoform X1 [Onychostruthus taczanowskii]|uniref:RELT-like protein 2 isoform X1 n=1 Tax=Onychostruthus taczanowskii TaxID=356909 RepID=UPI001B7FF714|nr:RELT-like protein 2 isoform X1 [Onychostruthus taczanowskii]XP_041274511.1 RELT-like protein 2 isoform X1 [Onychostruthus taczanowskii]
MSDYHDPHDGESDPQHGITVVFLLVLVFFIMGLVGFLICHVLKKKGYRCRTFRDELDPDDKDGVEELQDDEAEKNDDTVEKIVRCIIQNEGEHFLGWPRAVLTTLADAFLFFSLSSANVEALKEMLGENEGDVPLPVPSLCHHSSSQDGGPPHHHTVHLGSTQAPCIHCSRRKRHPLQRQGRSKEGKSRMHPGETTVFSVGRFRVTHIGKKPSVQEQQDGALPAGSRPPSTEELERSSEMLQRERALNGTVPTGGLQNGAIPTGTQSGRSAEQSLSASPAANTPASSGTRDSRRAGAGSGTAGSGPVGLGTAGSLQDAGSAPGSSSRQRRLMSLPVLGASSPNIPGELAREGAGICLEEIGLASADEVSDIHGSLSLQEQADELGRDESSRKQSGGEDGKQQEPSAAEQDRV